MNGSRPLIQRGSVDDLQPPAKAQLMGVAASEVAVSGAATPTQTRKRKLVNLGLLIGSFGSGQGAIFLVQTLLVSYGHLELLATCGTLFSFAILAALLIDFGVLTNSQPRLECR